MASLSSLRLSKLSSGFDAGRAVPAHVQQLQRWVADYLTQPNPGLGRAGPVCPFARPSMDRDLIWVGAVRGVSPAPADVVTLLDEFRGVFCELPPASGRDVLLKATLIAFPDIVDYSLIDHVQRALKPRYVAAGLMIGQFYDGCQEPGLWNDGFRPLQSPVPLIAIRHMVSSDFPFLNSEPEWIEAYLRLFAPTVPSPVRAALAVGFGAEK